VQGIGRDTGVFKAAGKLVGEYDIGELRLAVGRLPGVIAGALQVVELDPALCLYVRGNGDDSRGCAGLEPIQKEVGEQEGGKVVDSECVLQAIGRRVLWAQNPPTLLTSTSSRG